MNTVEVQNSKFYTKIIESVHQVERKAWNECANFNNDDTYVGNPFLSHEFFCSLEDSGSVSKETGWISQHILLSVNNSIVGILPNFIKNHSWGEYIFDQVFAQALENAGGKYYPKLLSAVPFSPVPGERFLIKAGYDKQEIIKLLLNALEELIEIYKVSSGHINFINKDQIKYFSSEHSWLERQNIQFHWNNDNYENFDHFLSKLSSSKRKTIRREREEIYKSSINLEIISGDDIKNSHAERFNKFYLSTIEKKWGGAYLNEKFWHLMVENLSKRIVFIFAKEENDYFAGAINLIDNNTIYGRNWGSLKQIKFLHFEACYYQAIEFAINNGLKKVEAGAQGIHKIQRGYLPTKTYSLHKFSNQGLSEAAKKYLNAEKIQIEKEIGFLETKSPFKNKL